MFSLYLPTSECSNMNGSEILKCCSITNRTELIQHTTSCACKACVCVCPLFVYVRTCVYQHISLRETKNVMATST